VRVVAVQPNSPFHGIEGVKHMDSTIRPGTDEKRRISSGGVLGLCDMRCNNYQERPGGRGAPTVRSVPIARKNGVLLVFY
jgi:hypothetical protein